MADDTTAPAISEDLRERMAEAAKDAFADDERPDGTRYLSDLRNPWRALDHALNAAFAEVAPEMERLSEIERVTAPPAGDDEMPTDPAELREMWEFINRQARWQWHMAHRFGEQVERLRAELAETQKRKAWAIDQADKQFRGRREAEAERDALRAAIAEQIPRTLNAAADKLHALPATDGAALKGPYWYRQGFTQAADLLRDWADYPAALSAPESDEAGEQWAKRLADASLAVARAKFGPEHFPQSVEDAPTERPKLLTGNGMKRRPSEELTPIYEDPDDATAKLKHVGGRANAEDCPACSGTNPPYPFICPGEPEGERNEYVMCNECGSEPTGNYPVAHKPSCSRMTIAPHLWPSPDAPAEETDG